MRGGEHTRDPVIDSLVVLSSVFDILMYLARLKYLSGLVPGTFGSSVTHCFPCRTNPYPYADQQ
jgi:hypothetical protein